MKNYKVLFLDKDTKEIPRASKYVLIISPSFYWFTKEKLNISLSKAKKVAPSMFEGVIPEGKYSYYTQKVGDEYYFFAYKDEDILKKIEELGLKPSQISKVYLAHMVFKDIKEPVLVGSKVIIKDEDGVAFLPKDLVGLKVKKTDLNSLELPKTSLPLKTYSTIFISEEQIYTLSILLFIAIMLYAVETFLHKRDLAILDAKERAIIEKYNLPPTTIQIENILSSLRKIQKEQLKLREDIEYILRAPLKKDEYIQLLKYGKKIIFEIVTPSKNRAEFLKRYLQKKLTLEDISMDGKILRVECKR